MKSTHCAANRAAEAVHRRLFARAILGLASAFALAQCGRDDVVSGGGPSELVEAGDADAGGWDATGDVQPAPQDADDVQAQEEVGDSGPVGCQSAAECPQTAPYCDGPTQTCVACIASSQCPAPGDRCVDHTCQPKIACNNDKVCLSTDAVCDKASGMCVSCLADSDCAAPNTCQGGSCLPAPKPCQSSKICAPLGKVCDVATKVCSDCADDLDCPASQFCKLGFCTQDVCSPGSGSCSPGGQVRTCTANGSGWEVQPCKADAVCEDGKCAALICTPGALRCSGTAAEKCSASGTGWQAIQDCGATAQACQDGACVQAACSAGSKICAGGGVVTCSADQLGWGTPQPCPAESTCEDGTCKPWVCTPATQSCVGQTAVVCSGDGLVASSSDCAADGKLCSEGSCLAAKCTPGQSQCVGNKLRTCSADGQNWGPANPCPGDASCTEGVCKPWVCLPGSQSCIAGDAVLCSADGLTTTTEKCTAAGKFCDEGQCKAPICTPGATLCQGNAISTCVNKGLQWSAPIACPSGSSCAAGVCKGWACTPGSKGCVGNAVQVCAADGLSSSVSENCSTSNKVCSGGTCMAPVCTPGSKACDGNQVVLCNDQGLAWGAPSPCAANTTCNKGQCQAWVCTPNAGTCMGNSATTCAADGLSSSAVDCALSGKVCANGACQVAICAANSTACAGNGVTTCNATGTAWGPNQACGANSSCDQGKCKPWVCQPGAASCDGALLTVCSSNGLTQSLTDCATSGKLCVGGACQSQLCKPGARQCAGNLSQICDNTGAAWLTVSCSDSDECTADSCNPANGDCVHPPLNCDDGNACTDDSCNSGTGKCQNTANKGSCFGADRCQLHSCVQGQCQPASADVVTLAGSIQAGLVDGQGESARLYNAFGAARAGSGDLWVVERSHHVVRRIAPDGTVTTVAGGAGQVGNTDGPAQLARFSAPSAIAVDAGGLVYIADAGNHRVRRLSPGGTVSTLAGSTAGYADGTGSAAKFYGIEAMTIDPAGNLYVSDLNNHRIRKVTPGGLVTTVAGSGVAGYLDAAASSARFYSPVGLAWSSDGSLLVADTGNHRVRRIDLAKGLVSTVAGSGANGNQDGAASSASFSSPTAILEMNQGIAVYSSGGGLLRLLSGGTVSTIGGLGAATQDGPLAGSKLAGVTALGVDGQQRMVLVQTSRVRYVTPTQVLCADGSPCTAEKCDPTSGKCQVTTAPAGSACSDDNACTLNDSCDAKGSCQGTAKACNDGNACTEDLCIAGLGSCQSAAWTANCSDGDACTPQDLCVDGQCRSDLAAITTLAGQASTGFANGKGSAASFSAVFDAVWLPDGSALLADPNNHALRLVKADGSVTTWCGGNGGGFVDGACSQAKFSAPYGLDRDAQGTVYVADTGNHRIRAISPSGLVTTLAGSGSAGYQDGAASSAAFKSPYDVAVAADGSVAVADSGNFRLRKIAKDGSVATLAGAGTSGKQDGAASSATFATVSGLAYDTQGRLWISDVGNAAVRRLGKDMTVSTLAGGIGTGQVDGNAAVAKFQTPYHLAVDAAGNAWIGDAGGGRLRKLSPAGIVSTVLGSVPGFADGPATTALLTSPTAVAVDAQGRILVGDAYRVRIATLAQIDCDDGQPCTLDACSKLSGACSHSPQGDGASCSDGNACTSGESCAKGQCAGGFSVTCSDNNPCTSDSCDVQTGCSYTPTAEGQSCGAGKVCAAGSCSAEACLTMQPQSGVYVGAPVTMETYSHGGGYSPTYQEYWYPGWPGTTVHRYDKNRKYVGSFSTGIGTVMQLAGDSDDTYYTAHWNQNLVVKRSGMSANSLWTYNLASTACCVAVDNQYVYAIGAPTNVVHVLSKAQGTLVKKVTLAATITQPYGSLAVVGGSLFVGDSNNLVRRFDKVTGQPIDSFQTQTYIFNMAYDGKNYCISENSKTLYCYTIAVKPAGCP